MCQERTGPLRLPTQDARGLALARRWCSRDLTPFHASGEDRRDETESLALDNPIPAPTFEPA